MPKNPKPALRISNNRLQQELLSVFKSIKPKKRPQNVKVWRGTFLEENDLQNNKELHLYQLLQKALKDHP